jgi:hypothetical protein
MTPPGWTPPGWTPPGWTPPGYQPPSWNSKGRFTGCLGIGVAIFFALVVLLLLVFVPARVFRAG